jgi:hypothetical protein
MSARRVIQLECLSLPLETLVTPAAMASTEAQVLQEHLQAARARHDLTINRTYRLIQHSTEAVEAARIRMERSYRFLRDTQR